MCFIHDEAVEDLARWQAEWQWKEERLTERWNQGREGPWSCVRDLQCSSRGCLRVHWRNLRLANRFVMLGMTFGVSAVLKFFLQYGSWWRRIFASFHGLGSSVCFELLWMPVLCKLTTGTYKLFSSHAVQLWAGFCTFLAGGHRKDLFRQQA